MGFGVSFLPSDQNGPQNQQNPLGQQGGAPPLQQAIQMLSLRLPRVVGSQGLAPGPLLQSPGGSGIEEILRRLFGGGGAPGRSGGPLPLPKVNPGADAPPTGGRPITEGTPLPGTGSPWPELPPGTYHPGGYDPGAMGAPAPRPTGIRDSLGTLNKTY